MTILQTAPAKINLCLFLGPARDDGRHELVTVFDSLSLCDELDVDDGPRDEVVCEAVEGPNLVADALGELRAIGWAAPPLTVRITKRIPVAAGMGGGSADAAAMLRLAPRLAPVGAEALQRIAAGLGADVPAQLDPGPSVGTGAGDVVEPLDALPPYGVLVLPLPFPLATADVYREADRLGLARATEELLAVGERLEAGWDPGLIVNDLQPAALSLAPQIGRPLEAARRAGADQTLVCGSGPTVIGLFWGQDGSERAERAAVRLRTEHPGAVAAEPVARVRHNLP